MLYGAFLALKPARLGEIAGGTILINGQPLKLPVEPVLKLIALGGFGRHRVRHRPRHDGPMADARALLVCAGRRGAGRTIRFSAARSTFYLFTLPAWQLVTGWLMTLAVVVCAMAVFFVVVDRRDPRPGRVLTRGRKNDALAGPWRGLSIAFAAFLLMLAARVYLGRFERLLEDHTIFAGVTYTEAHVTLTGMLVVAAALVAGAVMAAINAVAAPRLRWLIASVVPGRRLLRRASSVIGWYVSGFIVKPNELVREQPYITQQHRDDAAGVRAGPHRAAPVSGRIRASRRSTPTNNQATLQNIRLWDWRALQDTLRQIQEIRTYYDFPDIDIDRYEIGGTVRQMMLAVARAEHRSAAGEQPQLDQREADLHARLRRDDEPGERLHAGRAAGARAQQHAGSEHDAGASR